MRTTRTCRTAYLIFFFWAIAGGSLRAQELAGIAIHGFATQGVLYTSHNNYLTMQSSSGSLQWTEGAVNATRSFSDSFHLGAQLHIYQLGQLGGARPLVDWALGDYKVNDYFGFRAGKVKTVAGLFNDSQDVDAVFVWTLLPQSAYPVDDESFTLAHIGGDIYGYLPVGKLSGKIHYTGFVGHISLARNDGYVKQIEQDGLFFADPPEGLTYGGDLRWEAPISGLTAGCSAVVEALDARSPTSSLHVRPFVANSEYAQFTRRKLFLAGEYHRTPTAVVTTFGPESFPYREDLRVWYVMSSYRLASKLHVGTYYSYAINTSIAGSPPQKFSKDWAISGRYDFNAYFYGKIEGHFLHGTGLGYYENTNPNGLKPNSDMLAAKIGFSF